MKNFLKTPTGNSLIFFLFFLSLGGTLFLYPNNDTEKKPTGFRTLKNCSLFFKNTCKKNKISIRKQSHLDTKRFDNIPLKRHRLEVHLSTKNQKALFKLIKEVETKYPVKIKDLMIKQSPKKSLNAKILYDFYEQF